MITPPGNVHHRDLPQESLHVPKFHASTHLAGGTDPLPIGTGASGYSGYSGYSGSGISGYSGYSGSGISGYSGSGISGYSGSGISGYSGSGISGYSGPGVSGYSGYSGSGISGYSGYSGSGVSGYSGYSGSGISGYSGSGISGYSGSGISGYSGYSGSGISGYSGYSGSGISGYSGSGISGYSGSGISGYSGSGISGYSGYSGATGINPMFRYTWSATYTNNGAIYQDGSYFYINEIDAGGNNCTNVWSGIKTGDYLQILSRQGTSHSIYWVGQDATLIANYYKFAFSQISVVGSFIEGDPVSVVWVPKGTSGYSGYSGSGVSGYSGSGISGYSGYSGSGISGYSGYSGYSGSGVSGYSGYSGSGISGYSGYSGSGISGYSGYSGSGVSGYSGYSGSGVSGYSGYSGSGISGYSGYSGVLPMLVAVPGADHTADGITITLTAHDNQAFGDICYINADGEAQIAKADVIATSSAIVMCAAATINANDPGLYLVHGIARHAAWSWTPGNLLYLTITGTTANTISNAAPVATGNAVQIIGVATNATRVYFNPTLVQIEII